jgi:hypothetical protein
MKNEILQHMTFTERGIFMKSKSVGKKIKVIIITLLIIRLLFALLSSYFYQNRNLILTVGAQFLVNNTGKDIVKVQSYPDVYISSADYSVDDLCEYMNYTAEPEKRLGQKFFVTKEGKEFYILEITHNNCKVYRIDEYDG